LGGRVWGRLLSSEVVGGGLINGMKWWCESMAVKGIVSVIVASVDVSVNMPHERIGVSYQHA
jgi:hypothetical protein